MPRIRYKKYKTPTFRKVIDKIYWTKQGGISNINTSSSTGNSFDGWLLTFGFWEDDKFWRDTASWQDISYL